MTRAIERLGVPHRFAGPLVVSVFLASATVLLDHYTPFLEWLDVAMLRVAPSAWLEIFTPAREAASEILVVTIGPAFFETEFGGESPIRRGPFVKLLKDVDDRFKPKVLAIDYDLSPHCGDVMTDQQAEEFNCGPGVRRPDGDRPQLDKFLRKPREESKLVLVGHLPVKSEPLCNQKLKWEREMQAAGVRFGSHELIHHGLLNVVVKYEKRNDSFARQAGAAAE